ncbi:putative H/ACA ribonucleoprotein complex subunit 1 [Penaeus vannamei]|uniref:H/ACA ribonucleoprotein complex subunit n=1 Tax=Penaeus vannamei TaxID=6689 RepID=A0A423SP14_PENVA|nr:putative H/ACA ribonucleoprotein complex subunit 1 [Penaeus vannamei]
MKLQNALGVCSSFRGGRGGGFGGRDQGPPERVLEYALFTHTAQEDLVCKVTHKDVPYFNAPIFLQNKEQIGKVDEIFGTPHDKYISVKLGENFKASSFEKDTKLFIDEAKLLPLFMFLPGHKRGGGRGGRGGREVVCRLLAASGNISTADRVRLDTVRMALCRLIYQSGVQGVRSYSTGGLNDVVIVSAVRTPMGSFSTIIAWGTALGTVAIKAAVERAGVDPKAVQEVYMGNVCQAGAKQAPLDKLHSLQVSTRALPVQLSTRCVPQE